MTPPSIAIAQHRFGFGYYRQLYWNWLIGSAFFLGGIGGATFLLSMLTGFRPGMIFGYLVVVAGKNTAHLLFLGRPERFWRAAMRPDRSWIARGIWATGVLAVSGFICLLPQGHFAGWVVPAAVLSAARIAAMASAFFIMFYDGFVMNSSPAIAFWNSKMLPLLILMYASLGGTTISLALRELLGVEDPARAMLSQAEQILLVANFLLLAGYLARMSRWSPAAKETVRMLLRGAYARVFLGLVVAVGLFATMLLSIAHHAVGGPLLVVLIALSELTGDFALVMVLLKSGLFSPQSAPIGQGGQRNLRPASGASA
jgi:formate-dependent nitrite reductase membrane component NrfD